MRYSKTDRAAALESFRRFCPPGTNLYTILRSVSRSGMSRTISVLAIHPDGSKTHHNYDTAVLTGSPLVTGFKDGVKVGGCGMDMGFHLIDALSYAAYGVPCIQGKYDSRLDGKTPDTIVWAGWL